MGHFQEVEQNRYQSGRPGGILFLVWPGLSVLVGLPIWKGIGEDNQKNAGRRVVQNVRSGRSRHQVEVSAVEANGPALGEGGGNQILDLLRCSGGMHDPDIIYDLVEGEDAVKI